MVVHKDSRRVTTRFPPVKGKICGGNSATVVGSGHGDSRPNTRIQQTRLHYLRRGGWLPAPIDVIDLT